MFEYHRSDEQTYGGPSMHLPPRQNRSQRLLSVSFDSVVDCRSSCFPYSKCMSENNRLVLPENMPLMDAAEQYFEDIDLEQH